MRHFALVITLALSTMVATPTASAFVNAKPDAPKIYVQADTNFTTALTAAMIKKDVPATIVEDKTAADYVLQSAEVDSKEESTGGKIARCLFMD